LKRRLRNIGSRDYDVTSGSIPPTEYLMEQMLFLSSQSKVNPIKEYSTLVTVLSPAETEGVLRNYHMHVQMMRL